MDRLVRSAGWLGWFGWLGWLVVWLIELTCWLVDWLFGCLLGWAGCLIVLVGWLGWLVVLMVFSELEPMIRNLNVSNCFINFHLM